jgi:hypothetical protein
MNDPIHERGQAIENLFFAQSDQQLLAKMKAELAAEEARGALRHASGISDPAVLDALLANHITPESLTSVGLIPLVAVAWADDSMEESEKAAILQAADISGVKAGSVGYEMLEKWLSQRPSPELLAGWKAYVGALHDVLDPAALAQLKTSVLGRAKEVAKSAGGFLGLGNKVSDSEQKVLDDLSNTFG